MATNNQRLRALRRRVQADPASIGFAQIAEKARRAGRANEAIGICRAGLAHHPSLLAARVTLGRALIAVGRLDEAAVELSQVVQAVPNDLPAVRGLGEVHLAQAFAHYKRALQLARRDRVLEDFVERLAAVVAAIPGPSRRSPARDEVLDFDTRLTAPGKIAPLPGGRGNRPVEPRRVGVDSELEGWLTSIVADRRPPPGVA